MDKKDNTLIFLDEIQAYPALLTLLKFLKQDDKFTYICSGSLLEVTLSLTSSIPMGSIRVLRMYPLDFEEFIRANGFNLYYYDVRGKGEVDFVVDDYDNLCALPIEVKSGKNYTIHNAINGFLSNPSYNIKKGIVFSNSRDVVIKDNKILYLPIYYVMFLKPNQNENIKID